MAKRDYYEVLGVAKTATADEIKKVLLGENTAICLFLSCNVLL